MLLLPEVVGAAKIEWADDTVRTQTLRFLPASGTNELITVAARKSALLFYGMEVTTYQADSNRITLAIDGPPDSYLGAALAVAVDSHGYFLTAGHVTRSPPPFTLVFHDGSVLRSAPARIVAQIPEELPKTSRPRDIGEVLDLALLHTEGVRTDNVFEWAEIKPKPDRNSVVVQLGAAKGRFSDTNAFMRFSAVAGHLKKVISLRTGGTVIQSDIPGRPGDSGGPLMSSKGELLGITSGLDVKLFRKSLATATRPDLGWLRATIEKDQLRLAEGETNRPTRENSGNPAYVTIRFPQ